MWTEKQEHSALGLAFTSAPLPVQVVGTVPMHLLNIFVRMSSKSPEFHDKQTIAIAGPPCRYHACVHMCTSTARLHSSKTSSGNTSQTATSSGPSGILSRVSAGCARSGSTARVLVRVGARSVGTFSRRSEQMHTRTGLDLPD